MTIDFWGVGLQAVNVLILVWLLSRLFWRPVAAAIVTRRDAARTLLSDASTAQARADAALAEVATARAGIATERTAVLAEAATQADAASKAALAEARDKADKLVAVAEAASARDADAARADTAARSAELAVDIARKLLARLPTDDVQARFLDLLIAAIRQLPPQDRATLTGTAGGIDLVSPGELRASEKAKITEAVQQALGGTAALNFVSDPDLIAGVEMRTAHFVVHNSWQSDLDDILKDMKHAA